MADHNSPRMYMHIFPQVLHIIHAVLNVYIPKHTYVPSGAGISSVLISYNYLTGAVKLILVSY